VAKNQIIIIGILFFIFLIYINSNKSTVINTKNKSNTKSVKTSHNTEKNYIKNLELQKKDSIFVVEINEDDLRFKKLRNTYYNEIGVKEEGGNNKGKRIKEYLNSVKLDEGYAWCAAFICWGLTNNDFLNPKSAWSPTVSNFNIIYRKGDKHFPSGEGLIFSLYYKNLGRIGHVGYIEDVKDDYVLTIEGNTNGNGEREGDGVHRKRRPINTVYRVSKYNKVLEKI